MTIVCGVSEINFAIVGTDTRVKDLDGHLFDGAYKLDHWTGGWFAGAGANPLIVHMRAALTAPGFPGHVDAIEERLCDSWHAVLPGLLEEHPELAQHIRRTSVLLSLELAGGSEPECTAAVFAPGQGQRRLIRRPTGAVVVLWPQGMDVHGAEHRIVPRLPRPDPQAPVEDRLLGSVGRLAALIHEAASISGEVSGVADLGIHGTTLDPSRRFQRFRGPAREIAAARTVVDLIAFEHANP